MYVEAMVPECDYTDRKYSPAVKGAYVVAQGATGRYCAVMYVGPEYLKEHNIHPKTYDEAVAIIEAEPNAWVDF